MKADAILIFATLGALVGLPIGGIWCLRHQCPRAGWVTIALWVVLVSAIVVRVAWARRKEAQEDAEGIAERQRHGIRPRSEIDLVVSHSEWRDDWVFPANWHDWVEGETRALLPDDVLLKWEWQAGPRCGAGGYAVERKGKIVAQIKLWVS